MTTQLTQPMKRLKFRWQYLLALVLIAVSVSAQAANLSIRPEEATQ